MPATYSDILTAKLALQCRVAGPAEVRECLNAQEAGRRAGIEQSFPQVMVKRGYLTRSGQRDLETLGARTERGRLAKLAVQLLLRRGQPPEAVLRRYYESLKAQEFPVAISVVLEADGLIAPDERAGLEGAIARSLPALCEREARELAALVEGSALHRRVPAQPLAQLPTAQVRAYHASGQRPVYPPPSGLRPAFAPPSGLRPAFVPGIAQAPSYPPPGGPLPAGAGFDPAAEPAYLTMPPERLAPGNGPPAPDMPLPTTIRVAAGSPRPPGLAPPVIPVLDVEAGTAAPADPYAGAAPPPGWQPPPPIVREIPRTMQERYTRTAERAAAHLHELPDWAKTGMRRVEPMLDLPAPHAEPRPRTEDRVEPVGAVPGYEILDRLGKGKVGVVYRALEQSTGRIVALKVLLPLFHKNPTLVERFRREADIAAKLDHPNVRRIYSGGEAEGQLYIAMEFIDGETLQDKLDRLRVLPEPECLRWIAQVARAMDHYDRIGMLHRDVKPANILVTRDNRALLCDLGISKRVYEDYALTMQGTTLGSPWYLSPEQGLGTDDLDIRSDIYSLGVTLFHCLTGRVPFHGGNAGVIISKHAREPIPDLRRLNPKISRGAAALVERMMAKRREDRHQTPKELLAEIAWLRSESGVASTPIVPLDPPSVDEQEAALRMRPGFFRRVLRAIGIG